MALPSGSIGRFLLWLATVAGLVAFVSLRESEQRERLEGLSRQLGDLQNALAAAKGTAIPPAAQPLTGPGPRSATIDAVAIEALAQRVADLVGERLKREAPPSPTPASRDAPPQAPASLTREQQASLGRAYDVLNSAIARGSLRREDVYEMSRQLAVVNSPRDAEELNRKIMAALNANKLTPEDPHLIFP